MRPLAGSRWWIKLPLVLLLAMGGLALVRDTVYQGQDFEVFWRTAKYVLQGLPAYDLSRDGAMAFKYPPWILPLFFPFSLLNLESAKWVWGFLELGWLTYICRWCLRQGATLRTVYLMLFLFWGIWAVHAMDGQINLLILSIVLASWRTGRIQGFVGLLWALSTKIFSLVILLGNKPFKGFKPRDYVAVPAVLIALSLPAWFSSADRRPEYFLKSWVSTAASGGSAFDGQKVRGRDNQGLPALALRTLGVDASQSQMDLYAFLIVAMLCCVFWRRASRTMDWQGQLVGWLALIPVVHPLSWFHLFVFAFPLCVWLLDRGRGATRYLAVLLVTVVTRKTLGSVGEIAELCSVKSWGVLFGLYSLRQSYRVNVPSND